MFVILGVAWVAKVTLFTPETQWTEAAELPGIHGVVVAAALGAVYLCIFAAAQWPHRRRAKGEIHGQEPGDWKGDE